MQELDEGKIDLMITPDYTISGNHPSYVLYHEPQLVAGWSGNPALAGGTISEAAFFEAGHVAVVIGTSGTASYADRQLELMGRKRTIQVTAAFFTAVPWLLEGTARLALMHSRLARRLEGRFAIATAPLPFDMPPMNQMLSYHAGPQGRRRPYAGCAIVSARSPTRTHKVSGYSSIQTSIFTNLSG